MRATRLRRLLLACAGIVVGLLCVGALYQTLSARREAARFPPPGRLVDIGGRRLHLVCLGTGEPTVVFEGGAFQGALSSEAARTEVGAKNRVCSYDRRSTGWSDPGPGGPISLGQLADDLRLLLDRTGIDRPVVLVPSSLGGLVVEAFARRYPERVAGLVFVDAGSSEMLERGLAIVGPHEVEAICLASAASRIGVLRLLDPFGLRGGPSEQAARTAAFLYRTGLMDTLCGLARGLPTSRQELRDAPPLRPDVPLVVLVHERDTGFLPPGVSFLSRNPRYAAFMAEWLPVQQRLAARSMRGRWRIVAGSDHLVARSQPHVVAAAVLEVVSEAR